MYFILCLIHLTGNGQNELKAKFQNNAPSIKNDCIRLESFRSDTFPDFKLPDLNGNIISYYQIEPKVYSVIIFWNSGHNFNLHELEKINSLIGKYQKRINFIFLSNDKDENMWKKSVADLNNKGIMLIDTNNIVLKRLKPAEKLPMYLLLNQKHKILEIVYSAIPLKEKLDKYYFIYDGLEIHNLP